MSATNKILPPKSGFCHDLDYGIGGIRGKFGFFPINPTTFFALGQALGRLTKTGSFHKNPQILLLQDTRESCQELAQALCLGLELAKINVVSCGVLPTPAAHILLEHFKDAAFAVVISASHNSAEFNGLKIFSRRGNLSTVQIKSLNRFFTQLYKPDVNLNKGAASLFTRQLLAELAQEIYAQHILRQFKPKDFDGTKKIVFDCANGAASEVAPVIFSALKLNFALINATPNGENINFGCGSTNPEALSAAVVQQQADIGFSFDGDADRVVGCDAAGKIKDGDDFLAALSLTQPFAAQKKIIGTVMSNQALELFLAKNNQTLLRSDVGELNVAALMTKERALLGGEPSGHILVGHGTHSSDGILTALCTLKNLLQQDNLAFKTFTKFPSTLTAISTENKFPLDDPGLQRIIALAKAELPQGRIFLRYSQTEPVLRILVESEDERKNQQACVELAAQLQKILLVSSERA